jgi:hypothetical protein
MLIVGIDPGLTGGIAIIPVYAFHRTVAYPFSKFTLSDISSLLFDFRHGISEFYEDTACEIYIEQPSLNPYLPGPSRKMRNSQSFWKLGRSLGQLEGVCYAHGYQPTMINPRKWQNYLNCSTGSNKKITHKLANQVFAFMSVERKNGNQRSLVTHAVADALLIALYGYLQVAQTKYVPKTVYQYLPHVIGANNRKGEKDVNTSTDERNVPKRPGTSGTRPSVTPRSHRRMPPRKRS